VVSVYVIYGSLAVPKWPVTSSKLLDDLTDIIHLTVTAFTMLRGFLGVKWFRYCILFDGSIVLDIPKREVGSKVVNLTLQIKH